MLPYALSLRSQLGADIQIDLLVREECEPIPQQLGLFNKVHVLKGGRNTKLQLLHFLFIYPRLMFRRYDTLLDLQNHRLSRVMRFFLGIKRFSVFDRTSSNYAGDRYRATINATGHFNVNFQPVRFENAIRNKTLQKFNLINENGNFVIINPAGAFTNRHWPIKNYVDFCRLWNDRVDRDTKFLLLGLKEKMEEQVAFLRDELKEKTIDLTGKTSAFEAMLICSAAKLVVSEDSGLLHMAYVNGTPSVGLLGSTRDDWTNPKLQNTFFFNSSDMSCGNCMRETCIHEEIKCMTRISPQSVLSASLSLMENGEMQKKI